MNRKRLYILLDIILIIGVALSLFLFSNKQLAGVTAAALIMTLIHQKECAERDYFKCMPTKDDPIQALRRKLLRWLLTFSALIMIIAGLVDYFG